TLPWNHILGFYDNHIPISYKKSIFEKVYKLENDRISNTLKNRFRTKEDISHWLIRYWQICEGKFYPRSSSFGAYYNITQNPVDIVEELKSSKHKVICLNDNDSLTDYEKAKKMILREFEKKYNDKSRFER
ncbi:capsule biosynthesis protein CapG, partial [Enterococcus faecium]|nr:capsule biosynthesis protein CapG [Enterococcus faecium]